MGNQPVKQATRYRNRTLQPKDYRNNYSIQVNSRNGGENSFKDDMNTPSSQRNRKKSLNISQNEQSILKYLIGSKQAKEPMNNKVFANNQYLTIDYNTNGNAVPRKSRKQNDRVLQNLSRKNQQLRKQLKQINEQLTEKLKRKKLIPKKKKNQDEDTPQHLQGKKQNQAKTAGLRRQLENGYKQIDMYKRTLIQLKSKQETEVSSNKIKQMENQIAEYDRIINETIKKIDGMKNVKKHQEKNLQTDINQDLMDSVQLLKKQEDQIRQKIKEITKRDVQRQNNYKKQQAYQFQVQKKYRQMSGQYFPQLKKKSSNQQSIGKKPSTFDKFSSPQKKNEQEYPSVFQVKSTTDELNQLRLKHEQYHKKINAQLQIKNKSNEQLQKVDEQIKAKDKIIESLKNKLVEIRKIIRPNRKSLFGYDSYEGSELQSQYGGAQQAEKQIQQQHQQDQFDIKHLIANIPKPIRLKPVEIQINNSIRSGASGATKPPNEAGKGMVVTGQKSQPKVWGNVLTRKQEKGKSYKSQLLFDDSVQFQSSEIQPLIIGINVWVNKNGEILAIQAIYLNKEQIRYGVKSSSVADGFFVRYDLQAPDYLKNITGGFNQSGILQYIAFYSKKGKAGTFGNKRQNQQSFTFGLASNERPFRLNGATLMVESQPRVCRIGVQICTQ